MLDTKGVPRCCIKMATLAFAGHARGCGQVAGRTRWLDWIVGWDASTVSVCAAIFFSFFLSSARREITRNNARIHQRANTIFFVTSQLRDQCLLCSPRRCRRCQECRQLKRRWGRWGADLWRWTVTHMTGQLKAYICSFSRKGRRGPPGAVLAIFGLVFRNPCMCLLRTLSMVNRC